MRHQDIFRDEAGFTTISVVLALLITLALVFSAGQVYRINTAASEVQNVADVAALAAENEIAEFMIVVYVCDAVVLSLSLTSVLATSLGLVAICVPSGQTVGQGLLKAGQQVAQARDTFAQQAATGLNNLQKLLPFFAAVQAARVASANNGTSSNYVALAVLAPYEGKEIVVDVDDEISEVQETVDRESEGIEQAAQQAEQAAQEASAAKLEAFEHDCGLSPSYCMYERADHLASLSAFENPLYQSVDAWSFSVALERSQAYYAARLALEQPQDSSTEEIVKSVLRADYYEYALEQLKQGYVHETADSFDAYFPELPKNTAEMKQTELYTNEVYPCSIDDENNVVMHAWEGCSGITTVSSYSSLSQMDEGSYEVCPVCGLTSTSLGTVASASTSIQNGFEYHYSIVADAAQEYEKARDEMDPYTDEVKGSVTGLLDQLEEVFGSVSGKRIVAEPPGSQGVVVLVANISEVSASQGFENLFVDSGATLGVRVAVSAATLVADSSESNQSVITALLDGVSSQGGILTGTLGIVLDCWSGLLGVYAGGYEAMDTVLKETLDSLPLASESGLGTWASNELEEMIVSVGLEPARLDALKPVLVNSAHVANADESSFSAQLISLKQQVIAYPLSSSDIFTSLIDVLEQQAIDELSQGTIEIATIEVFAGEGPSIPLEISLPTAVVNAATDTVSVLADQLRSMVAVFSGNRVWE